MSTYESKNEISNRQPYTGHYKHVTLIGINTIHGVGFSSIRYFQLFAFSRKMQKSTVEVISIKIVKLRNITIRNTKLNS